MLGGDSSSGSRGGKKKTIGATLLRNRAGRGGDERKMVMNQMGTIILVSEF